MLDITVKSINEFKQFEPNLVEDEAFFLKRAKIVWIDYNLLLNDFPHLSDALLLKTDPSGRHQLIDAWLLHHCAIISTAQATSSYFDIDYKKKKNIYRPPRYGRAGIVQISDDPFPSLDPPKCEGLFDVKGIGVTKGAEPTMDVHSDGSLHLSSAINELVNQKILEKIFQEISLDILGVPVYAVIDTGENAYNNELKWIDSVLAGIKHPTGLLVRRAHIRHPDNNEIPKAGSKEHTITLLIELVLRSYGVTSCGSNTRLEISSIDGRTTCIYGGEVILRNRSIELDKLLATCGIKVPSTFDCLNIQTTRCISSDPLMVRLIDFGHYKIANEFNHPILTLVQDRPLNWGGVIGKDSEMWANPQDNLSLYSIHTKHRLPSREITKYFSLPPSASLSGIEIFTLDLVQKIRCGAEDISKYINNFISLVFGR